MVIGAHVDQHTRDKIKWGEYVEFSRLLPKEKMPSDKSKWELVNKGGQTYFVPVEHESVSINSFHRWEQAFRIFVNFYSREHPDRSSELIQYNHVIFTAAMTFTWENVYSYDKEFRMHMSSFPERSWAVILQQAWAMNLKDRVIQHNGNGNRFNGNNSHRNRKEICKRFNKGLCSMGQSCKYDHRCLECGKFGHGEHICRRKQNTTQAGPGKTESSGNPVVQATSSK